MKLSTIVFISILIQSDISAQITYDNFKLIPANPEPSQSIQIEYTPIAQLLNSGVRAFIYFNQTFEKWSRAIEVPTQRIDEKLIAVVVPSMQDVSFLVVFIDSLGNVIDNNNNLGYWTPLFKDGEPIPGSFASIANMFYGVAKADVYKIKSNRDLARNLYEQDFKKRPEIKRFYWAQYISSIRYEKKPNLWLNEINQYSSMNDLTDWELLELSKKFAVIKDTVRSKKFEHLILEKHPFGEWSLQQTSVKFQTEYAKCKNADERMAVTGEHLAKFSSWPLNEDARRYLETVIGVIFLKGIDEYIAQGRFQEWKGLANSLRDRGKYFAYFFGARRLVEKGLFLKQAEELAYDAVRWREITLDSPRMYIDWPYLSDLEVRYNRMQYLSEWLEVYGTCLRLQGKNEDARNAFEKAQLYSEHRVAKLKAKPPVKLLSEELPSISFSDHNNKLIDFSQYKGKTIVLDFWASWCAPCIVGFKTMNELEQQFSKRGVEFLFVDTQEKGTDMEIRKRAKKILKEQGYDFNVLFDLQNKAGSRFDFDAIPTTVVIDKDGMVRYKQTGIDEEENLQEVLTRLISEK